MTFRYTTLLTGLFLLLSSSAWSQHDVHPCGANDLSTIKPLDQWTPAELEAIDAADAELEEFTRAFAESHGDGARNTYVIPIVFHIIHNDGPENISDDQLIDAVRVLNEDFNRMNSDWANVRPEFLGLVADVGIEFRLALKDPSGNCTKGITRTMSPLTNDGTQTMKNLIQWPRNRYLNVWVAASANGAAGYTNYPSAFNNNPQGDGIVLLHTYTGSIGTSNVNRSHTLTHEVGHWINLRHTWGNSNEPTLSSNCNEDDNVDDTPNTIGWTSCNLNGTSCNSLDNVENYMEYSYCSKMFTVGQSTRMLAALNSGTAQRSQLWQTSNLTFTGVNIAPLLCAAEFESDARVTCAGTTVSFSDVSFHGVTSRTWSFPGATPETSTGESVQVVYAESGVYPVTLTVSNGTTTLTTTQNSYITVLPNPGAPMPFDEGFEAYNSMNDAPWFVSNPNGNNTWSLTTDAAHSGNKSLRIQNNTGMVGDSDELVSHTMDLSNTSGIRISYRYAYARRTTSDDDRLRVLVSNDCGATWSLRQQLRANNLLNTAGGVVTGNFVPTASQWRYTEVPSPGSSYLTGNFRIKFELISDGGNNVYIDDININGSPVGMADMVTSGQDLLVMPNPATDAAQVMFTLTTPGQVRLEVLDVLGRTIQILRNDMTGSGIHRVELPVASMPSGVYFVRLLLNEQSRTVRFVVK